jgi:uncharacterized membrane protein YcaP (DUF421 family)
MSLLTTSLPWWEFALRAVVVYVFLLAAIRLSGKRQSGQYSPYDLILLLIISNAVQNSMNGGDNSLVGGLISALTLIALNYAVAWVTFKFKKAETLKRYHMLLLADGRVFVADVCYILTRNYNNCGSNLSSFL